MFLEHMCYANCCKVCAMCSQVLLFSVGLHKQTGKVLGAAAWLGVWFPITHVARRWAHNAAKWNAEAGRQIWRERFLPVHRLVWRLILIYLLWNVVELVAAAMSKWLALQFHDKNHFERMQVRL
jgi:hypothetical protein